MSAHERASRLLVGGVFFDKPIPQRSGAQHVSVALPQEAARLERPRLVSIVGQETAAIQVRRYAARVLVIGIKRALSGGLETLHVRLNLGVGPQDKHAV